MRFLPGRRPRSPGCPIPPKAFAASSTARSTVSLEPVSIRTATIFRPISFASSAAVASSAARSLAAMATDWIQKRNLPESEARPSPTVGIHEDLSPDFFRLRSFHLLTAEFSFSQPTWRDWVRASRKLDRLDGSDVDEALDLKLSEWLEGEAPERFKVPHRIELHLFQPKG